MARLPPKPRKELSPEQQATHDMFTDVAHKSFGPTGENFKYEQPDGALMGPFPFFIAHPQVGNQLMDLLRAMAKLPLPPEARETAILTAAAQFGCGYVGYSHVSQAINTEKLSVEQAKTLKEGKKPDGLNEQCSVAFAVAKHLSSKPGPLPQDLWQKAVDVLGKDAVLALLHYIGFYSYVIIALNGVDAPVPK